MSKFGRRFTPHGAQASGMPGGNAGMLAQLEKLQQKAGDARERIEQTEFEGQAGSGAVKVRINGANEVLEVAMDPEIIDSEDLELLGDLIVVACNAAIRAAAEAMDEALAQASAGMPQIPGLTDI
jgi:DNA-binding YbaB/EbfC family protein